VTHRDLNCEMLTFTSKQRKQMASALDSWNPKKEGAPDYYETVKYVYKYLDFHIAEHEAYLILDMFIFKWNDSVGKKIFEDEFKIHVLDLLREHHYIFMPEKNIGRIIELIIGYLREVGQFQNAEAA